MSASQRIRVLLVDDSPLAITVLGRVLAGYDDIEVVGSTNEGQQVLDLVGRLNPDVVCTDYHMPRMTGVDVITQIMAQAPRPVLVVTSSFADKSAPKVFTSLAAGAVDVVLKPMIGARAEDQVARDLAAGIRRASKVVAARRPATLAAAAAVPARAPLGLVRPRAGVRIVGIGASTGGPQALEQLLGALPSSSPVPILLVQHIGESFVPMFADWLRQVSRLNVSLANHGELPRPGTVYLSPADYHLRLDTTGRLALTRSDPLGGHRPSATVLFDSLADSCGAACVTVLLTGMGADGARGMLKCHQAGGVTIAQDEATSLVFGMPKQAIELRAATHVLPLNAIAATLETLVGRKG